MPSHHPRIVAGFDIGTNTTRFLALERLPDGRLRRLQEELAFTRTGEGLAASGVIGESGITRTVDLMTKLLKVTPPAWKEHLWAFATESFRRASNGREVADRIGRETGVPVTILSPEQEAESGLAALQASFNLPPSNIAVGDVGGGSTELLVRHEGTLLPCSIPLGAVVLTESHGLAQGPVTKEQLDALRSAVRNAMVRGYASLQQVGIGLPGSAGSGLTFFGVGGAATTAAQFLLGDIPYTPERVHGSRLTAAGMEGLVERLATMTLEQRLAFRCLPPGRADIAVASMVLLRTLMEYVGTESMIVSAEGILYGRLAQVLTTME